jgi:hypothetical protein
MEQFTTRLYEEMESHISRICQQCDNMELQARQALTVLWDILHRLRAFIVQYSFRDSKEEIRFFKEIKPQFLAKLIYFQRICYIETHSPRAVPSLRRELLEREQRRIRAFFRQHMEFFHYFKCGAVYRDEEFFTRKTPRKFLAEELCIMDPEFSTLYSLRLARILAYGPLSVYLDNALQRVGQRTGAFLTRSVPGLTWTAPKAYLIELLYALYSTGVFNHGRADLKKIAQFLEAAFQVQLGNYYRVFQDIRIRKKSRTSFLDQMRELLLRRMDETDDPVSG